MAEYDDGAVKGLRLARVLVWLAYAFFVAAMIILVLAFFLQLFNASTSAEFTQWVYRSANRLMEPFRGIFPQQTVGESGSIVNFAMAFAIIMYGIFALLVHALVDWLDRKILQRRSENQREAARAQATGYQQQAAAVQQPGQAAGQPPQYGQQPPQYGQDPRAQVGQAQVGQAQGIPSQEAQPPEAGGSPDQPPTSQTPPSTTDTP
jgi:uncharacterized protein YggT (Ycf19 family)